MGTRTSVREERTLMSCVRRCLGAAFRVSEECVVESKMSALYCT